MTTSSSSDPDPDAPDLELLALLRASLNGPAPIPASSPETDVLPSASYIYDHSIDVALDSRATKAAAQKIWTSMQEKEYSTSTWSTHELHPAPSEGEDTLDFIFTMDLLNFCFWSEISQDHRFQIEYRGKRYTGYNSLVAALRRALDQEIPITSPAFWRNEEECTLDVLKDVFRSATDEEMPLMEERLACLREAGDVLCTRFDGRFSTCVEHADKSAAALVSFLAENFDCFRDEFEFEGRRVRFLKRAQILVADVWACFDGRRWGEFHDIDKITTFADYRVPQILHTLGCLLYSPSVESHIRSLKPIESGHSWEIQIRGCTIWCIEMIKKQIIREHHPEPHKINAILIDFFLYDTMKQLELDGKEEIPHHRTRSIWY
ncbi:MAG: hypothetical protein M1816_002823 [Peltula sp. TS41687]|nr:MAG: hypothetical protein M1816_002823 [Peltula sp. TS41687]